MADGSITIKTDIDNSKAYKQIQQLDERIEDLQAKLSRSGKEKSALETKLARARREAELTVGRIKDLKQEQDRFIDLKFMPDRTVDQETEFRALEARHVETGNLLNKEREHYQKQIEDIKKIESSIDAVNGKISKQERGLQRLQDESTELRREIADRNESAIGEAFNKIGKNAITLVRRIFSVATAAMLIRRAFQSMVRNLQEFAKADTETQNNINDLKTAMASLRGSWTAAFAPIANAVIPMLTNLINWLTRAANAVAQFLAILGGKSTYKKAVGNMNAVGAGAAGAAKEIKEAKKQLAGFDELEILSDDKSNAGGGGGGGGGAGYTVEEIPINQDLQNRMSWVVEHLDLIKDLVTAVAVGFLAWEIGKKLFDDMGDVAGFALVIGGIALLVKEYFDAWANGVNWDNLTGMLIGLAAVVAGIVLLCDLQAGMIALLIGGIALLVVGIKDWIEKGELTTQTFVLLVAAILAVGIAVAVLTGSWIPLLIAAIAGFVLAGIKYKDEIKAWFDELKEKIATKVAEIKENIAEKVDAIKEKIAEFKDNLAEKFDAIREKVQAVKDKFGEIKDTIDEKVLGALAGLETFRAGVEEKVQAVKDKFTEIRDDIGEKIQAIREFFNFDWSFPKLTLPHFSLTMGDEFAGTVLANYLGISGWPKISVSWYAKGGIVDGATLIGAGEAGKEAIVPLERNTEWIQTVARGIVEYMTRSNVLNEIAAAFAASPMPAVARGYLAPPNAIAATSALSGLSDTLSRLEALLGTSNSTSGNVEEFRLFIDGYEMHTRMKKYERREERANG